MCWWVGVSFGKLIRKRGYGGSVDGIVCVKYRL